MLETTTRRRLGAHGHAIAAVSRRPPSSSPDAERRCAGRRRPGARIGGGDPEPVHRRRRARLADAVIHITDATPDPASFGDSSNVRAGDISFAIGSPLGLRSSVTEGIVSSVSRSVSEGNGVTLSGRVIGIPTLAGLDQEFGDAQAPGIGFAIPSSTVQRLANQILCGAAPPRMQ